MEAGNGATILHTEAIVDENDFALKFCLSKSIQSIVSSIHSALEITFQLFIALRGCVRTLELEEGVGTSPPARGSTPAPRPNHNDYRYVFKLFSKKR